MGLVIFGILAIALLTVTAIFDESIEFETSEKGFYLTIK